MLDRSQISADRIFKETIVMANFTTEDKHSVQVGNNFYNKKNGAFDVVSGLF